MRVDLVELLRCPLSGGVVRLEEHERDGDQVETGVLLGDSSRYPIVSGIPVMRGGYDDIVDVLRSGDTASATALAILRHVPMSRLDALLPLLVDLRPTRAIGRWLQGRRDRIIARRGVETLASASGSPDPLLRLTHLDHRRPNPEGYRYFRYRLGLPRHLVALGAVSAARPTSGPVLELGCGAGHLTWQFQSMLADRRYLAVERDLDLLWIARHHLAPAVDHVCADGTSLPFADGVFSLAIAVDVLSFVDAKAIVVRELRRVIGPGGGLVLSSLINAAIDQEYAGRPLPVDSWCRLVEGMGTRVFSDRTVLDAYLDGTTAPACSDNSDLLGAARTITLLADEAAFASAGEALDGWPHAMGRLGPHPVLNVVDLSDAANARYQRSIPSAGFGRDNPDLYSYLPEELVVSRSAIESARNGETPAELAGAIATIGVLGYPSGSWPADPWSP